MNTSEESGEWTNPGGQKERSMEENEEEETEEELETSSEIEDEYSVEEEEEEEEEEGENSRSESSPHMHVANGHGNSDENDHDDDEEEEEEDSEEEDADIGVKEDHSSRQVQQNSIPPNGIQQGNTKMTSSPRERHFVVTRQRDAVPMTQHAVKQNGNLVPRQDHQNVEEMEEEEEEIEPGIIGPLHIDHVDFILDSIDAELSDLITRSARGSPQEGKKKKNHTKKKTSFTEVSANVEGTLQNGHKSADTTLDDTLPQTHPGQLHPSQPGQRYGVIPGSNKNKKTGKGRMKTRSQPSLSSPPKLRINSYSMDDSVGTVSDADSISAEEVRRRVVQSLHQQEHPNVIPKKSPSRTRRKTSSRTRRTQPQSDPESVQTEDYEKRFRSVMVRHVAGVPLSSFDSVTIQSDLDSVKSLDIKKKFRKAVHKHEVSGTSSIEEEEVQSSKVAPRSQRSKGSRSSSLRSQSSESLKMKATIQQAKKSNPQVMTGPQAAMHPNHPTMHLTSPALHHSSMPNLSTAVLPGHSHPSVHPQTYAPPPREKWRSPPRVSHLESQPSPLRKSAKSSSTEAVHHREGNIHQSEGYHQPSSHEHPGLRAVGQPQMTSTPHPSHSGGAGYMDQRSQAERQALLQQMMQSESSLRTSLEAMQASMKELKKRKQDAIDELKSLQEAVKRNKSDIQQAEEMARLSVEKGDGLRSELMVLEYQRDQARRELKDLEEGIAARRNPSDDARGAERGPAGANGGLAQIGLTAEEILAVIQERDELHEKLETERGSHVSKKEHEEVMRQLDQTRQELFESQKASRAKVEKLQEDLEEGRGKIESLKLIESDLKKELSDAQEAKKNSETEHQKQLLEKTTAMEEMQAKSTTESAELRHKLSESAQRIMTLESALLDKDVVTTRMQERIRGQGQEVLELTNKVEELEKEKEAGARKAETTKEVALVELRGKLLKEKDEELDQQKKMIEKAHQEILAKQQTQATQRQTQLEKENEEKESELKELREKLASLEISTRTLGDQMRQEAQEQIQKALEEQKAVFDTESEKERQREALAKEDAVAIETKHLKEELKREKQLRETLKTSQSNMKEELEKLRDENLAAGREKVEAVSKAREEARQEIQSQLDQIRDQMAQEKTRETEKLQQKLRQQDEELTQLRSEVKGYRQKQRDSSSNQSSMDQSYRSIVMELNEECRKTSNLVGSTPRKVPLFSSRNMKADSPSQTGSSKQASFNSPGRTQLMAAISNLKATNDDLRNYIKSLRDDLEKQRRATARANREKDNEVKKLVESMGREKAQVFEGERDVELDRLQRSVSLLQDSENSLQQELMNKDEELRQIQSNMATWKEETALKMARKFEDELNKELEVRLEESHSGSGSFKSGHSDSRMRNSALGTSTPSSVGSSETGTSKLLRHLQDRVKQLRIENTSLKQASRLDNSLDGGDASFQKSLQLEEKDQQLYRLDQKVKLLERQLWVAEERCRENAALLSQKTAENTRLEGALTQQTKELMRMERAYNKLSQSNPTSPVP